MHFGKEISINIGIHKAGSSIKNFEDNGRSNFANENFSNVLRRHSRVLLIGNPQKRDEYKSIISYKFSSAKVANRLRIAPLRFTVALPSKSLKRSTI